jgi:ATP-dependent RNA helicase DHX36
MAFAEFFEVDFDFVADSKLRTHSLCSDHIALLKAFEGWKDAKRSGKDRAFCWDNFLSSVTLQMMEDMRMQFVDLLSGIGFVDKSRGAIVSS